MLIIFVLVHICIITCIHFTLFTFYVVYMHIVNNFGIATGIIHLHQTFLVSASQRT